MRVRLEPLGETIDCAPGETVLDAAFRQGLNLAHGCREGQCSACKCHLLSGDVDLKPYSSFALSEGEREGGYALMCRAVPTGDLEVELLHYDPESVRLEHAIVNGVATVEAIEELTHDIVGVTLKVQEPADFSWLPGQYIDLYVPGLEEVRRSFSVASLPQSGSVQLMIKRYPGGRFSSLLGNEIESQTQLHFAGPYGAFHLRRSERPILMVAGGSGMAPVLGVLRQLVQEGCDRPVRFLYGAREQRDLFALEEIAALGRRLSDFRFTPVTGRFVHEAIDEELDHPDVYMCGPTPMLEAIEELMVARGVDPSRIFQDRFTASAEAPQPRHEISPREISQANAPAFADERAFSWFTPAARRATIYEDVTVDTQPSIHRHLTRGWPLYFADGRGTWNEASTAVHSTDWFAFRDPGRHWERPFYQRAAATEQGLQAGVALAAEQGLLDDMTPRWRELLRTSLQIPAFVEHGLWFALATAARDCLSDSVATCVCLQASMKQRSAQAVVLYAMDLEGHLGEELPIEPSRRAFLDDAAWQPTRRYLERLAATPDWCEVIVAANLCFEPSVGTLLRRELGTRLASANGDVVTPALARAAIAEWEWTRRWTVALVQFLRADQVHGAHNRGVIGGWIEDWRPEATAAASALGSGRAFESYADAVLAEALTGAAKATPRASGSSRSPEVSPREISQANAPAFADHVGIVMARSAEGDAVARFFSGRAEVIEQPSFWEIRAPARLVVRYADISDELGYEVDAYSIQHEMSTHYGRMVATDDALMLFADPTEAMEHLLS
jgi:NAD(P)H-flavin reductase/ferredoxin